MNDNDLKLNRQWHSQWRSGEHAAWFAECGPAAPNSAQKHETSPTHSFLTDLLESFKQAGNPAEYAAGFRTRLAEIPMVEDAHPSRRAGWEDADTELLEEARHRRWVQEGREDGYLGTRRLLYEAGHTARVNGVLFEEGRTEPWMAGWVAADILIGAEPGF